MNGALRAAIRGSQSHCSHLQNALFHSTPVLERKRRTSWESKANVHNKRYRRRREKQALLHNVSAFADHLFGSWHDEFDTNDQSSSRHSSWFKKQYCKGSGRNRSGKCGPQSRGKSEKKSYCF